MTDEETKVSLSFDKYTECIIAMQKLKDIKAIAAEWKRGIEEEAYEIAIGNEDAILAILAILQYNY